MSAEPASEFWRFAGLVGPLLVRSEAALAPHRDRFLATWPMARGTPDAEPDIELVADPGGWRVIARRLAPAEASEVLHATEHAAVQGLSGALAACAVRQDLRCIGLHCSAVALADGLVLLPGASLSGKSTLAIQLAARGARLFGDDRLALRFAAERIAGVALGLTPKLRLPLPVQAGPRYRAFIEERLLLTAVDVAYVRPREGEIARFGESAAITALVLPRRRAGTDAAPEAATRDMVFRILLETAYAPHVAQSDLFARLEALSRLPAFALPFESSAAAADELLAWFGGDVGSATRRS